ncbi:redoxin family protein [Pseudomonas sp. NPDC007930]|uniref:TlpA family protein disulfide reductase n=1 Tax=Pseudomonas sp. NPDC007930 TaxID=3364417 RepID=UPI0036E8BB86
MLSLALGPFTLSLTHLALLASLALALGVAHWLDRAAYNPVWRLALLALLGARVAFVLAYWPLYRGAGLQMLDIRDGGFLPWAGVALALAGAAWLAWQRPPRRRGVLAGVASGVALWVAASSGINAWAEGSPLPNTVVQRADGSRVSLEQFQGKPLVVNLWATWCPPCRREMPVLAAARQQYPHVHFLFINQGESVGAVANFVATSGLPLSQMLFDPPGAFAREVGAMALPTTLFYSASGQLLGTHLGELSEASLAHGMKVLAQPPSVP